MSDIKTLKIAKRKQESREICKRILDFGVTEDQKIDIMFNLAMTIENNNTMKEITDVLKKYLDNINNEKQEDNNNKSKIIL